MNQQKSGVPVFFSKKTGVREMLGVLVSQKKILKTQDKI